MERKPQPLHPEVVNGFLKEIQQGSPLEVTALSEKYKLHLPLDIEDLLLCTNRHGDTPILIAARHGHVHILRTLHESYKIPLSHCNNDGKGALHEAAQNGQVDCIHYLIQMGSDVDCLKKADWTPLMLACTRDCKATIEALVGYKASLKLRNKDGWNPFHIACREGHRNVVQFLLETDPDHSNWNTTSKNGRTPLHTAALHGKVDVLKLMKEKCNYDPNCKDSCGVTPLMDASRGDNVPATTMLIKEFGSQLDIEDTLGRQAIHHAAQAGAVGVLKCLIEHGVDVNKKASVNHITPLHYAAKEGKSEAVSLLLAHGADPRSTDKKGRTALDIARHAREATQAVHILENAI